MAATVKRLALKELVAPRAVIDVGANNGQFTPFALQAWPGCQVLAFEPGPAARYRRVTDGLPGSLLQRIR